MAENDLAGATALVTGASRAFGRGIANALRGAGAQVLGSPVIASSTPTIPASWCSAPAQARSCGPLQHHTWETFSVNWQADVRIAFHRLRGALLKRLRPDSRVVVVSSGAALAGSPLSGGYAGAKATLRFITGYAQDAYLLTAAGLGPLS